jgi:hypothetical protein
MTDNVQTTDGAERLSAKVYQFPLRGRLLDKARELEVPRFRVASGDSWYHQDAIDEDKH